jgi:hypothetical protein
MIALMCSTAKKNDSIPVSVHELYIPYKIYTATNETIATAWIAPWYKDFVAYYLTSSGIEGRLFGDGYAFYLQHQNCKVNIYRWSGSFLDLGRHWSIEFLDNNEIIGTFKTRL